MSEADSHPGAGDPGATGLHPMTKVEVVVNGADVASIQRIFEAAGVSGFTMLGNVSGAGHGGFHEGRLAFNDRDGLVMLITVAPEAAALDLVDRLRVLLENRPGVMFVTPTMVSRPSYFVR
jgi:nitrogen regulatory protein PII